MSSELMAGWDKENCPTPGGIHSIVLYNMENRLSYTVAAGVITALTMMTAKQAFEIIPDIEMIGATQTAPRTRENNSFWIDQTVLAKISGDTAAYNTLLDEVQQGFLGCIIRRATADPAVFVNRHYGFINGMVVATIDGVVGQTFDEGVNDTINLVGKEIARAQLIDDAIVDTMLTPAP